MLWPLVRIFIIISAQSCTVKRVESHDNAPLDIYCCTTSDAAEASSRLMHTHRRECHLVFKQSITRGRSTHSISVKDNRITHHSTNRIVLVDDILVSIQHGRSTNTPSCVRSRGPYVNVPSCCGLIIVCAYNSKIQFTLILSREEKACVAMMMQDERTTYY